MDYKLITKLHGTLIRHVEFSHDDTLVAISGEATYIGTLGGNPLFRGNFRNDWEKFYYNLIQEHFKNLTIGESKWSPDDKYLYCTTDGEIYRFSVERQEFRRFFVPGPDAWRFPLEHIAMNEKKQVIAVAGKGGVEGKPDLIYVIDLSGKILFSFPSKHGAEVTSIVFSPDGTKLVSTGKDSFLRVWSADNGTMLSEIKMEVSGYNDLLEFINETTVLEKREPYPTYAIDPAGKASFVRNFASVLPKSGKLLGIHRSKPLLISDDGYSNSSTLKLIDYDGKEQGKIDVGEYIGFVTIANKHDLLAVALKAQVARPEVHFYSTEPASKFLPAEAATGTWMVDAVKSSKARGFNFFVPYEKYPGLWIGMDASSIIIYDADFNVKHKFPPGRYQIQRAVFHAKSQKAALTQGSQLFIIDFNKLDLQGTNPPLPQEEARVETGGDLADFQWNNTGDRIACITQSQRELVIWEGSKLAEIYRSPTIPSIQKIAWSADDSMIALIADKTTFHYFDVAKKAIVKTLTAFGDSGINSVAWHNTRNELILTAGRFISVFNQDGNPLRKIDLRAESKDYISVEKPTCSPSTHEISVVVKITREGTFHYILDLDKPVRECITARLHHHMKHINFLQWDQPNRIISMGSDDGLAIWQRK